MRDHVVEMGAPLLGGATRAGSSCITDVKLDLNAGIRTFFMSDLWVMCSFGQKLKLLSAYFINMAFAALRPISALFLSKSLQALAEHQHKFSFMYIDVTPKTALYLSVCLAGLDFVSDYLKNWVLAGIADSKEAVKIEEVMRAYNDAEYQQHIALAPQAEEVLTDLTGAYNTIQLASVSNLQPQLFNLVMASVASFLIEKKALTWLVVPYIVMAVVVKELVHCCVREKSDASTPTRHQVLQRYRPPYGKTAMMYGSGRQEAEMKKTLDTLRASTNSRGTPKWHKNYRLLLGILTLSLSAYYIETVASSGLKPANIGQVTYMLSYLTTLFNSFSFFNQSVTDVKGSFAAIKSAARFRQHLLAVNDPIVHNEQSNAALAMEFRAVSYQYPLSKDASEILIPTVHDINMSFEPGEVAVLLGPSGSGKSTIAKLAAGLNHPTTGEIFVSGKNMASMSAQRRAEAVAYVPQCHKLQGDKSVLYHMLYAMCTDDIFAGLIDSNDSRLIAGLADTDYFARVCDVMSRCSLPESVMYQRESQLSASDRYKLSLAMALAKGSSVLVIDQMFGNFDEVTAAELREVVNKMEGVTRLIITDHPEYFPGSRQFILDHRGELQGSPNALMP